MSLYDYQKFTLANSKNTDKNFPVTPEFPLG